MTLADDLLERRFDLNVDSMVAGDVRDLLIKTRAIRRRTAGDEDPCAVAGELARDASANALRGAGHDRDSTVQSRLEWRHSSQSLVSHKTTKTQKREESINFALLQSQVAQPLRAGAAGDDLRSAFHHNSEASRVARFDRPDIFQVDEMRSMDA